MHAVAVLALLAATLLVASAQFAEYATLAVNGPQYMAFGTYGSKNFLSVADDLVGSPVFLWDNATSEFTSFQLLPETGDDLINAFITIQGNLYLGFSDSPKSTVYQFNPTANKFEEFQSITYPGGDIAFYADDQIAFMVLAAENNAPSQVYQFEDNTFKLIQSIPNVPGALWVDFFVSGSDLYLVTASTVSTVYLWNSTQFVVAQNFTMDVHAESFNIISAGDDIIFMASGEYLGPTYGYVGCALLLKWNTATTAFEFFQLIGSKTEYIIGTIGFSIAGNDYVAACNIAKPFVATNSTIYQYSPSSGQFELFQTIPTGLITRWTEFAINNEAYLAASTSFTPLGKPETVTAYYKWTGAN